MPGALNTCAALVPWDASRKVQRNCRRKPTVLRNDKWWCKEHAPFNDFSRLQIHRAECWRWHHACAVARVEELRRELRAIEWCFGEPEEGEGQCPRCGMFQLRGQHYDYCPLGTILASVAAPAPEPKEEGGSK